MIRPLSIALSLALAGCASGPVQEGPPAQAVAKHSAPPRHPQVLREAGMQGCVLVSFVIGEDGRAGEYRIEDSVPAGMFDQATVASLTEWRFEQPARPGRYAQLVNYRLDGPNAIRLQRECKPVPGFEALNPERAQP